MRTANQTKYVQPKNTVFRVVTNGAGDFRVQWKSRRWLRMRWEWLQEEHFSAWGFGFYGVTAKFKSIAIAESELKRAFGEQVEILHEWRAA